MQATDQNMEEESKVQEDSEMQSDTSSYYEEGEVVEKFSQDDDEVKEDKPIGQKLVVELDNKLIDI
jgi:hypothetical protein